MSTSEYEISRKLESLLLLCWDCAHCGNLDNNVIADGLDVAHDLLDELMAAMADKKAGEAA